MSSVSAHHHEGPPNSWLLVVLGLITVGVAAVLAVLLLADYLQTRPIDLRAATADLTRKVTGVLETNRVPVQNIAIVDRTRRKSDVAVWNHYSITVEVPGTLSARGLEQVLRGDLAARNVIVTSESDSPDERQLSLALGGQEFATLVLEGGADQASNRRDLTLPTERLASDIHRTLRRTLPQEVSLTRGMPAERTSETARWSYSTITVEVADGISLPPIIPILAEGLTNDDVTIDGSESGIIVRYEGMPAVEIDTGGDAGAMPEIELPQLMPPGNEPGLLPDDVPLLDTPAEGAAPDVLEEDALEQSLLQAPDEQFPGGEGARVAIIVDDGGNNKKWDDGFLALDANLTLAILPYTAHGAATATRAAERGFEVMLHMPMESDNGHVTHPGIVTTDMSKEEITERTLAAIREIPGVKGLNNHTGSKFTADREAMGAMLAIMKEHGLYFIDSRTSADSKVEELGAALKVPVASRDVFLDNHANGDSIAKQFDLLMAKAKKNGKAIGICHFRPATLRAMRELLPKLKAENIQLVPASDVVQ